jgi:hypothetical protein
MVRQAAGLVLPRRRWKHHSGLAMGTLLKR